MNDVIAAHQQGNFGAAESGYRAFLADRPNHSQTLQMFSLLLMQQKRSAEAMAVYRRVIDAEPAVPNHWANFGGMLRGAGQAAVAGDAYRRALALDPAHGAATFNLANLLGAAPPGGAGRPLDAAVWYERILAVTPDQEQARNNLDILRQRNADRFEAAMRREVARDPQSPHAHERLARTLLQSSGFLDWYPGKACVVDFPRALAAFDHLRFALAVQPEPEQGDRVRTWLALALDLLQLGTLDDDRLELAARTAWQRLRVKPKDSLAAALVGYHVYRRGRLTLASRLQTRFTARFTAAEIVADAELGYWSMLRADDAFFARLRPVDSVIARLPDLETLALETLAPETMAPETITDAGDGTTEPAIMVSGDDVYIRRFGPDLLQSIARHSPGASVVLHLVAPTAGTLGLVEEWRRRYPLALAVSRERPDLSGWPPVRRSTYFACVRFIRAFQWHQRLGRPLIVLDLDAVVRSDLRQLASGMTDRDLGLMLDKRRRGPFREILVGFDYYNNTPLAGRFLATVAAYIGHFLLDAEPRWMLDQSAHLATVDWFQRRNPPLRIRWHDFQGFAHCSFVGEK
nr:hypothetical protein [Azospirillum doebereinerae]